MDALTRRIAAARATSGPGARLAWLRDAYGARILAVAVVAYTIYAASTLGFTPDRFVRGL